METNISKKADLEQAADNHIRKVADAAGHPGWDWTTQDIADAFIAGAEWQKEQMMKEAVEAEAEVCKLTERAWITPTDGKRFQQDVYDNFKAGDKVKIIIVKQ